MRKQKRDFNLYVLLLNLRRFAEHFWLTQPDNKIFLIITINYSPVFLYAHKLTILIATNAHAHPVEIN